MVLALTPLQAATAAVSDVCPAPGASGTDNFADDETSVHEDNINCAADYGYVNGKTATTFDPNGNLTRGQAASLLVQWVEKATGSALVADSTDNFSDDDTSVHEENINKAADNGLISGFADGTFKPNDTISRAQFASIAVAATEKALGSALTADSTDNFSDDNGSVHEANINKAADNNLLSGTGANEFSPNADVTRGQTTSITIQAAGNVLQPAGKWAPVVTPNKGTITGKSASLTGTTPNRTGTYTFLNSKNESVTVTFDETNDKFSVDGNPVSFEIFFGAIDNGDQVEFIDDESATDLDEHKLTNVGTAKSGLVGQVETNNDQFAIVTGSNTLIKTWKYNVDTVYVVDGVSVSQAAFEAALSHGDTAVITDSDTDTTDAEKVELTNKSVNGTVSNVTKTTGVSTTFKLNGALGDDPDNAVNDVFSATAAEGAATPATQTYSVDGASKTYAQFEAAITAGDSLTYSRSGGVESFVLTNAAPTVLKGTATEAITTTGAGGSVVILDGTTDRTAAYTDTAKFFVDGVQVTETAFEAALTSGDGVEYQAADSTTSVTESIKLTNANLKGLVADVKSTGTFADTTANETVDVRNSAGGTIHEDLGTALGSSNRYFVNGTEVTYTNFEKYLDAIRAEQTGTSPKAPNDTLELVRGTIAFEYRLTTDNTI